MRWSWLFGNFADPELGLSSKEGHGLSDRAHREHMPRKSFLLWTATCIVLPVMIMFKFVLPAALQALGLSGQTGPNLIGMAIIVLLVWPLSACVYGHLYVKAMRRARRDEGEAVCIECGHSLERLPPGIDRCPECGHIRSSV